MEYVNCGLTLSHIFRCINKIYRILEGLLDLQPRKSFEEFNKSSTTRDEPAGENFGYDFDQDIDDDCDEGLQDAGLGTSQAEERQIKSV